jgi:hypothetical protein
MDDWEEPIKENWRRNKAVILEWVIASFGASDIERKVQDLKDMGSKPFSMIAHHNVLFEDVRTAFVSGAYYSALVGACALGERILNHLILDLRESFRDTPQYREIYRKESVHSWSAAIGILKRWSVLLPGAAEELERLAVLRNESIHFNIRTTVALRSEALKAIGHMGAIIDRQFGWFGGQPWFIEGVGGAAFIKKAYEAHPFVREYFIHRCPFVGVLHGFGARPNEFVDFADYGDGELTDEEFCSAYMSRDPSLIASHVPPAVINGP